MNLENPQSKDAQAASHAARVALRHNARARRRALGAGEHARLSAALCHNLLRCAFFVRAKRYAAFVSNDGEPDLAGLRFSALAAGKTAYLPVIHRSRLWFLPQEGAMALNRYGIAEPSSRPGSRISLLGLDLVLMPLVAFDEGGARLGMGGGFYDRTFGYLRHRTHWRRPRLIGVAFECQRVDQVPAQPWDVRLDGIMTERGLTLPVRRT